MTVNKVIAITMGWILAQLTCITVDGGLWGNPNGPLIGTINSLTGFDIMTSGGFSIIRLGTGIWNAFGKLVLWDYSFLDGNMFVVRLLLFAITVGAIYGYAQFIRGTA